MQTIRDHMFTSATTVLTHSEIGEVSFCEHLSLESLRNTHPNTEVFVFLFPHVLCSTCGQGYEALENEMNNIEGLDAPFDLDDFFAFYENFYGKACKDDEQD